MKYNLKNRPEKYINPVVEEWFEGFEKELREKLALHEKNLAYWESEKPVKQNAPLAKHKEEIAGEWRIGRAILREVLGETT